MTEILVAVEVLEDDGVVHELGQRSERRWQS